MAMDFRLDAIATSPHAIAERAKWPGGRYDSCNRRSWPHGGNPHPRRKLTPGDPPYKVSNSTDLRLSLQDGATPITITFNHPVTGVRANMRVHGRFEYKLTVIANKPSRWTPAEGEVDVSGFDFPGFQT